MIMYSKEVYPSRDNPNATREKLETARDRVKKRHETDGYWCD